jgi:two-component system, chemotaxis family, protein-glutamate methylesterase/glutaminase
MSPSKIKVIVADDSSFMRLVLSDMITSDNDLLLVATAENGKEAYEKVLNLKPDVLLLDVVMPEYDGLYAIKCIMKECPIPIVLLSSATTSQSEMVFEALGNGAYDFLEKPRGTFGSKIRDIEEQVIGKIKGAVLANSGGLSRKDSSFNNYRHTFETDLAYDIVVIGSSTGGTTPIEELLKKLPSNFPIPVVIVQHMPAEFVESFAKRLDKLVPLKVKVAEEGEVVAGGVVYIAPGTTNTLLRREVNGGKVRLRFTEKRFDEYNNPSVDCLFTSAATTYNERVLAIVLSGMGKDGTDGLGKLHARNAHTIAQDERSCVVFGMPKSAIDKGFVNKVIPMYEMGGYLVSCLS